MMSLKTVTIVGGGLAGLTLGIGLRQRGVPVILWEAGRYPRHRVCGEFISGNGLQVLERLGLRTPLLEAGAISVRTAMFVSGPHRSPVRSLPAPALGLSRHVLDALLADLFQRAGGELRVESRWTETEPREGVVRASGRQAQGAERLSRWFGAKAHVPRQNQPNLEADLEMHVSRDGYVGINRINGGEVNVCGLFRAAESRRRPESKQDWLRGEQGTLLHERLRGKAFDNESFCAVAGLELKPHRAAERADCCIGDAVTMTPPATGNGMSMAFESAEAAMEPLEAYGRGKQDWHSARREIARRCDAAFGRRLAWARLLQWMMLSPAVQGYWGPMFLRSDALWRFMFHHTR